MDHHGRGSAYRGLFYTRGKCRKFFFSTLGRLVSRGRKCAHQARSDPDNIADKYPDPGVVHIRHKRSAHSPGFIFYQGFPGSRFLVGADLRYSIIDRALPSEPYCGAPGGLTRQYFRECCLCNRKLSV